MKALRYSEKLGLSIGKIFSSVYNTRIDFIFSKMIKIFRFGILRKNIQFYVSYRHKH